MGPADGKMAPGQSAEKWSHSIVLHLVHWTKEPFDVPPPRPAETFRGPSAGMTLRQCPHCDKTAVYQAASGFLLVSFHGDGTLEMKSSPWETLCSQGA